MAALFPILLISKAPVKAQDQPTILVEQSVQIRYGQSLTFSVRANAPVSIAEARLIISVRNRADPWLSAASVIPGTTVTTSQTVSVESLGLPPIATLTYFWEFSDSSAQTFRGNAVTFQYEDNRVPWQWTPSPRDSISVYTDGADETVVEAAQDITRDAVVQASEMTGHPLQGDIHVYVYPELASLANSLRAHQMRVRDWVAAYAIPDQGAILVAASPGPELLVMLRRDVPHEVMHLAIYEAAGGNHDKVPAWFNEGLALNSSSEPDATLDQALYDAIQTGVLPSIEALCPSTLQGLNPHDAALAYAQSASFVRYIAERYGTSQVAAMMSGYADGLSCSGAVERALGIPLAEVERQWHTQLAASAPTLSPGEETAVTPWLIAWGISLVLALLFVYPQPMRHEETQVFDTRAALQAVPRDLPKKE